MIEKHHFSLKDFLKSNLRNWIEAPKDFCQTSTNHKIEKSRENKCLCNPLLSNFLFVFLICMTKPERTKHNFSCQLFSAILNKNYPLYSLTHFYLEIKSINNLTEKNLTMVSDKGRIIIVFSKGKSLEVPLVKKKPKRTE